jgi:GntR family transcriptional repressor for pyruvate dehydrogenase complex
MDPRRRPSTEEDPWPGLRPIRKPRLYEEAVRQIKSLILSRKLLPGERLPSERQLAQQLSIGRPAIREALRILGQLGLIEIRLGDGTYVREPNFLPYVESVASTIASRLSLEDDSFRKLWEVRKIFEMGLIRLACERITSEKIQMIADCLRQMEESIDEREAFLSRGEAFHLHLAEATGNEFLVLLYKSLWSLIHQHEYEVISRGYRQGIHSLRKTLAADQKIFAALAERDRLRAQQSMEEHLRSEEEILMAVLKKRKNHLRNEGRPRLPPKKP